MKTENRTIWKCVEDMKQLKKIRISLGITQKQIADYVGISVCRYGQIENCGWKVPSSLHSKKIGEFLNISNLKFDQAPQKLKKIEEKRKKHFDFIGVIKRSDFSDIEIGHTIGVTGTTVKKWILGKSYPSDLMIRRMNRFFYIEAKKKICSNCINIRYLDYRRVGRCFAEKSVSGNIESGLFCDYKIKK